MILESPLGNFSRVELNNKINPSFADVEVWVDPFQEGLSGQAITKYTKELFELIYLNFTSVNFNEVILENIKSLQLSPSVLEELVQKHYIENKKIISLEGNLLRLALDNKISRSEFVKFYVGNEINPNLKTFFKSINIDQN